jgi:hypothetical protein
VDQFAPWLQRAREVRCLLRETRLHAPAAMSTAMAVRLATGRQVIV